MKGRGDFARLRIATKLPLLFRKREMMLKMMKSQSHLCQVGVLTVILTLGTCGLAMAAGIHSASDYSLSTGPRFQTTGDRTHKNVSYTFSLVNGNSRDVLVRDVGQSGPGLQLIVPSGWGKTRTVLPHKSMNLTVTFHVSDCVKVPTGSWPLKMQVAWKAGKWQLVNLQMTNAGSMQWQKFIANSVCS